VAASTGAQASSLAEVATGTVALQSEAHSKSFLTFGDHNGQMFGYCRAELFQLLLLFLRVFHITQVFPMNRSIKILKSTALF